MVQHDAGIPGLADPRAPQPTASRAGLNSNPIWVPFRPSQYSGWVATGTPQTIDITSNIRFASGLEARYIQTEADGPTAGMLTFVNARRAVGGKAAVNVTGAALLTEFRRTGVGFYPVSTFAASPSSEAPKTVSRLLGPYGAATLPSSRRRQEPELQRLTLNFGIAVYASRCRR